MRRLLLVSVVGLALGLTLLVSGCGGANAEYLKKIDAVDGQVQPVISSVGGALDESAGAGGPTFMVMANLAKALTEAQVGQAVIDAYGTAAKIEPPAELKDAHQEYVRAIGGLSDELSSLQNQNSYPEGPSQASGDWLPAVDKYQAALEALKQ